MKRTVTAICVATCLMISLLAISSAQAVNSAKQAELLASCQKIQQYLTLPPETSAEQCALVALDIAVAQSQPLDESVDIAEVLRQASSFTTYGVQSDTFYYWSTDPTDHWEGIHRSTYTYSGIRQISEVEQDWDSDSARWVNANQTLTYYKGDGTLDSVKQQEWQTDHWLNTYLTSFTYSGGMTSTTLMRNWSGSAWVNYLRTTATYSAGRLATSTTELWQSGTSTWANSAKVTYTYDGSNNLTEYLMQTWSGSWVNQIRTTMTYNGSGDETQSIMHSWQGGAWVAASKYDYSYDGSGNEILDVYSIAAGSLWIAYDADTSKWSGGKNTEIVHNHMLPSPSVFRSQFTYDGNGNRTVDLGQDLSGSEWINSDRGVFVYQTLAVEVDNGRMPSVFELSQNYPNPFNPLTVIRYSLSRRSPVEIAVFNVLGQEVKRLENSLQPAGVYETTWDGTNRTGEKVASGIYFYRIKAGENIETRKMLLLK
ncbi:MAG: T9SS type A sorting domain-containing protein [candidate division Zixibacteria bacterium]|nr:T9SS type A sorting domain-containing protein [candidate division Zixibacteria bacterium]